MSVNGMKKWAEKSKVQAVFDDTDMHSLRLQLNRLLDEGQKPLTLLGEICKGADKKALMLVAVLIEDRGMSAHELPQRLTKYSDIVKQYFFHSANGKARLLERMPALALAAR